MINIKKKEMDDWTSADFVMFFKDKYNSTYADQPMVVEFGKDCMIMKRILIKFRKLNRTKLAMKRFIEWVFEQYESRRSEFHGNLTVGFLPYWVDEYIGEKPETKKKKSRQKVELSEETKKWLAAQKKTYSGETNDSTR